MKKYLLGLLSFLVFTPAFSQKQNWTNLFDGKTFNGFKQLNGQAKYEIKDGVMIGTTVANTLILLWQQKRSMAILYWNAN